jgi:hypothetical protein
LRRFLLLLVVLAACSRTTDTTSRATIITSLDQAIGGPTASGRVGDFLLENDQIRVIIEQPGRSRLPLDVGGSIVDLDLVRRESELKGGRGLDQLGQIAPLSNLYIARAMTPGEVRITGSERGAEVTTKAEAGPILRLIDALGLLVDRNFIDPSADYAKFRIYNEYELRPGERLLRVTTTVGYDVPFCPIGPTDGCNPGCDDAVYDDDCRCPELPARCQAARIVDASPLPDRPEPAGLSDIMLGDLPRPLGSGYCKGDDECDAAHAEVCTRITTQLGGDASVCRTPDARDAGMFFGDVLLYGGHLAPFVRGTGYDTDTDLRRLFDAGEDTLSTPLSLESVLAIGDRVSYAYAAPAGRIFVPIFGGPFSMGATGAASCRRDQPGCLEGAIVRAERWIAVGEGDAASAEEPILRARGEPLGAIEGVVSWAHSGQPVSGAQVFAIQDPRALACDQTCVARCMDLTSASDAAIAAMSIEQLFAANHCRTPHGAYLSGVAGIETFARTDVGTDPIHDGRFRMPIRAGRWVIVAEAKRAALSTLLPVTVTAGGTARAALSLVEPGRLQIALFDERGALAPGRATIGRCLPRAPCASSADCGAGETCEAGACACARAPLIPLELGGPRNGDGAIAHVQTDDGKGDVELAPGDYEVVFSRGPQSSISRATVTIQPGVTTRVSAQITRTIDRFDWAAADFHVHAGPSLDSGLDTKDRVTSFLAEDMDFLSSSDHDVLTRYAPLIDSLGHGARLGSQVGVEVTTQELGHFIGWPMKYEEWAGDPPERVLGNGAPDWRELTPQQIFSAIRSRHDPDHRGIVEVPHPYSYFDFYRLDPLTLEPSDSIVTLFNPLADPENFSGDFEAMELANSKSFDLLRRPTAGEVRFYSEGLDRLRAQFLAKAIDETTYQREVYSLSTEATRRFLHRTQAEQAAALAGEGNAIACRCGSDGDCAIGRVCSPITMTCETPPIDTSTSAGAPPPDRALCRSLRGVIDDWFNMLNRGVRRTGVSGSDVHGLTGYEAGIPRTLLRVDGTRPPHLEEREIADAVRAGRAIVTNGPMIHFTAGGGSLGDTITVPEGKDVRLQLRIEGAGWYDVDRVELYRGGELIHWFSGCNSRRSGDEEEPHGHSCLSSGRDDVVILDVELDDRPERDTWYVAIAIGLDGRTLAPVYGSAVLPRLGTFELTQRIYDIIPALGSLRTPRFPSLFPTFPFAVTNPIWVDVGGDGWRPSKTPPSWCTPGRDADCTR